ncbi:MAG: DUF86 domain-containing protein [Candidatus Omnitrophica bacterium]|nr:DUF86 domain-containing protein [Candidatus Omnitrophota bacterium]
MVNPETVNERLSEMRENILLLDELKAVSQKKFCSDPKIFKLAERCLEVAIQCILDICHHIIVDNDWSRPRDNKDALQIISSNKIIPKNFAKKIEPMAGLRNILAHEYLKVDPQLIYEHLNNLKDFRDFQKYVVKYLKKQ